MTGDVSDQVPALELDHLGKDYGPVRALGELSLSIPVGEIYGLLGPNGAGKTTALRGVLGFITPDRGTARVFGVDVGQGPIEAREAIGYLPGEIRLDPRPTGGQLLEQLGRLRPAFDPGYREELIERFQFDPTKQVKAYSKGNRQKLAIVAALQHRPRLALLDEPTSGLDPLMQRIFHGVVRELAEVGSAVLFSSHVLAEVSVVCDRVGVLRAGELVFEKPVSELASEAVRRVEIAFDGTPPTAEELGLEGVARLERRGQRLTFVLEGSPDPLIKVLARHSVLDLVIEPPDLEDLFMSYYER